MEYTVNPKTGRKILIGGETYLQLLKEYSSNPKLSQKNNKNVYTSVNRTRIGSGRGSATRGWKNVYPSTKGQRAHVKSQCGSKCFLLPSKLKFPVCERCKEDGYCSCKLDCRGLVTAKTRAGQWGYKGIASKARRLSKRHC